MRLSLGWHGRGVLEYDEGSGRVRVNEWRNCGEASGYGLFFNAALGDDRFHGGLGAAAIHVRGGSADTLR